MAYISFQPKDYFDTKLYTQSGSNNNGNTQTLTMDNVGFVWVKNRDYTNGHCIFDILLICHSSIEWYYRLKS